MSDTNYLQCVEEFHVAMNYLQPTPKIPNADACTIDLRIDLLREEVEELNKALIVDFVGQDALDALCDIQYVLSGAILALGFEPIFNSAFEAVHESNMSKLWSAKEVESHKGDFVFKKSGMPDRWIANRPDGKIMKPPSWTPPDLAKFV